MKLLYFASVRERLGKTEEILQPDPHWIVVGDIVNWLAARDAAHAAVFKDSALRIAVNGILAKHDHPLRDTQEVAFFPPMTGG